MRSIISKLVIPYDKRIPQRAFPNIKEAQSDSFAGEDICHKSKINDLSQSNHSMFEEFVVGSFTNLRIKNSVNRVRPEIARMNFNLVPLFIKESPRFRDEEERWTCIELWRTALASFKYDSNFSVGFKYVL